MRNWLLIAFLFVPAVEELAQAGRGIKHAGRSFAKFLFCLAACIRVLGASQAQLTLADNQGFCSGGSYNRAPFETFGSFCGPGDKTVGHAATSTFRFNGPFEISLSGYPFTDGLTLKLENVSDGQALDIRPDPVPGVDWKLYQFDIPDAWRGKDLRIVADDRATGIGGWLAFSSPRPAGNAKSFTAAKRIALKTLLLAFLLFLPGFALGALAIRQGVRGGTKLGLVILAGIPIPGYFIFWVYLYAPVAAYRISGILPYIVGTLLLLLVLRLTPAKRRRLVPFLIPVALTFFAASGIISLGYAQGGTEYANARARNRFSHPLPPDNEIPFLFAQALAKGQLPHPFLSDWLTSDRPPLQTEMLLALAPFMQKPGPQKEEERQRSELFYHLASVVMQSLWTFPVWLLLRAFRIGTLTTAAVIAAIYFTGFIIVNTFFVWPKLLAAAYFIAFAIPVLLSRHLSGRSNWPLRCLSAFLLAASLLAHGGSAFALLGILLYMLFQTVMRTPARGRLLKDVCFATLLTVVFYSPWIAYQKFIDPPGDRLLKYHLADVQPITKDSAAKVIYDAYRRQTFAQFLEAKQENIGALFGHESEFLQALPRLMSVDAKLLVRGLEFFFFLPSLGLLVFGFMGLLHPRVFARHASSRHELALARKLLLCSLCMLGPFILLMFKPDSTRLHQGTYALVIIAITASMLVFRVATPRLAIAVCALNCLLNWMIYAPDLSTVGLPPSLTLRPSPGMLVLHALSLWGFLAALALNKTRWPPINTHQRG